MIKWRFLAGKIICKWAIFHSYVSHYQRIYTIHNYIYSHSTLRILWGYNDVYIVDIIDTLASHGITAP